MTIQTQVKTADNGVDVEALHGIKKALTEMPAGGAVHLARELRMARRRAQRSRPSRRFSAPAPSDGGGNHGQSCGATTPVGLRRARRRHYAGGGPLREKVSCLTGGVAAIAQHRGIQLQSVKASVEGDMNLRGILGIDADVRNGFSAIRVTFDIDADASRDEIAAVVAQSQKRLAVFDIITNPGNVRVAVK